MFAWSFTVISPVPGIESVLLTYIFSERMNASTTGSVLTPWVSPPRITTLSTIHMLTVPALTLQPGPLPLILASLPVGLCDTPAWLSKRSSLTYPNKAHGPLPSPQANLSQEDGRSFFSWPGSSPWRSQSSLSNHHISRGNLLARPPGVFRVHPPGSTSTAATLDQAVSCLVPVTAAQLVSGF